MKKIAQEQKYIVLTAPVREGSTRPSSGWSEGETSPLKNIQHAAEEMMLQIENDMKNASAKLAAEQAERMVKDSIAASMERIKNENENMRNWEENMVRRSGYHVDGKSIHRDAVVDSSLGHTYYEGQSVHYYEDFYDAGPKISVSFSKEMLNGLTSSAIMLLVEQANLDIENWTTDIFGKVEKDDEGNSSLKQNYIARDSGNNSKIDIYKKLAKKDYDSLSESEQNEFNDLSELIVTVRDGKLGEWIGYAPQFKNGKDNAGNEDKNNKDLGMDLSKGRDWNIKHSGSGQMGKIMLDFQWNNMIEQQGWQKVALPAYDQPLWRGNGSWFEPPTIRGISSIVFEVVGTASGQKWFSYADDVIFAAIDLGGGFKSPEQVGLELAKTAATAALSAGIGAAGNAVSSSVSAAMDGAGKGWDFLAQSTISMTQSYVSTVGNSAINSVYINSDGTLDFNKEGFVDSLHSAGTISSVVGAGITGGLNGVYATDSNGIALNGRTFNTNGIHAMTGLAGGLTTNVVSLAIGGDATFNIASAYGVGFLEFSVGKNGVHSKFGMGGTNISYQNLKAAYGGLSEAKKVSDWKYDSGEEKKRTLNAINMLGYTNAGNNGQLASEIWNDTKKVEYQNIDGEYGHFNTCEDPNKVILSDALLGKGKEASAMLATVMSHEGTHVYGNRIEGVAHLAGLQTYSQLGEMFKLKGNSSFINSMINKTLDFSSWRENDVSENQYWKLKEKDDGTFGWQWDNDFDFNFDGGKISAEMMKEYISVSKSVKELVQNNKFIGRSFSKTKSETVMKSGSSEKTPLDLISNKVVSNIYKNNLDPSYYESFFFGTESFADASIAAKKVLGGIQNKDKKTQDYINEMNSALMAIQNTGLLEKNAYVAIASSGLNGDGTIDNPYLPLTGDIYVTCLSGFRFVTEDFYDSLKEDSRTNFPLNDFAKNIHLHTDLISDNFNIVTSVDGAIKLNYDDNWGLNGTNYSTNGHFAFLSNHMDPSSIKNYISLFGMQGTSMQKAGNGSYYIDGIKAGSVYGQMGQTGISGGKHVDFGIYQTKNPYILSIYGDTRVEFNKKFNGDIYKLKFQNDWVNDFSGKPTNNILDNYPEINKYLLNWTIKNIPNYSNSPYRG